jgi:glycogen operon protein
MTDEDWHDAGCRSVGMFLNGEGIQARGTMGERVVDDSFLILFNAGADDVDFALPDEAWGMRWRQLLDTWQPAPEGDDGPGFGPGEHVPLRSRSVVLLRRVH